MREEAQRIQDYLEINCSTNPEEIKERIGDLNVTACSMELENIRYEAIKELTYDTPINLN